MSAAGTPGRSHIVTLGADRILRDKAGLITGQRLGILTNHTGVLSDGRSTIDAVVDSGLGKLQALFGPEHGIAGNTPDGKHVEDAVHPHYSVPTYSLYGKNQKPSPEMLREIDVLICDIQDVGARFYTFISTIALAMEVAAEQKKKIVVLDRPNPLRGISFDGPVCQPMLKSFVGWMPIPITYGLTIGELARLCNEERWLANGIKADLAVVEMAGWNRSMWFDETGIRWIPPSPNMSSLATALLYPGLCLVEGTSISEGRGTATPFQIVGAPWADPERIMRIFSTFNVTGVRCSPVEFTPKEIAGVASQPKYQGETCHGISLAIEDRNSLRPVHLGISVLAAFKRAHPAETVFRDRRFDILSGNENMRTQLERGVDPAEICGGWQDELMSFGSTRKKYCLYE